ncbi:T9SS type A sorting domain-containing protein [Psychroserpens sp. MEBiC05023]
MKKILLLVVSFITCTLVNAQNTPECGTNWTPEAQSYFEQMLPQLQEYEREYFRLSAQGRRSSTAISSVPIKAHIVRPSAGFGGLTEVQLNDAIAIMNGYFSNALLEFFLCDGINYIDDDTFYDYVTDQEAALTGPNNVANVINIYFVNSISTTSGGGLCGYAYFPGGPETILMANGCTTNGSTLTHEMGHFFQLSHTHGNTNGTLTEELVDGSNCATTGDFLCDTPADPQLSFSKVNSSCIYTAAEADANGQLFMPNTRNIMSYSRQSCRTELSQDQYARIYATYQASRSVMACPSFNIDISSNASISCDATLDVDFTDNSVGATSWEWDVDGDDVIDYTTQNPTHTYNGEGSYDVALTISDGASTITKVYQNYVEVIAPLGITTTEIELTLVMDDFPGDISWNLIDSNGTSLYSSTGYTNGTDSNQTFTYDFIVSANECYIFEISDSFGDGLCCASGNGSYTLTTLEGTEIRTGAEIASGETTYMSNTTLSTDDFFSNNNVSVFPNPTEDILHIELSNSNNLPESYTIYNMLGQEVTKKSIHQLDDLNIQVKPFSNGMYYIKLSKGTSSITIPFVKQ